MSDVSLARYAGVLEDLYERTNRRALVHPDPLEFLYRYPAPCDREVVALVASSLAVGRVWLILRSVEEVLGRMGSRPRRYLCDTGAARIGRDFCDFRYRFFSGEQTGALLVGAKRAVARHGSLHACFASAMGPEDETVLPALGAFVRELSPRGRAGTLLPDPARGSACKRLNLMLRWLVRRDAVDPGGWDCVPPSRLVVPVDVHMFRIGRALGATARRQANLAAALEITAAFRAVAPADPVRYDFALTRLGIRDDADLDGFLGRCFAAGAAA